jgi:hypothetical protein
MWWEGSDVVRRLNSKVIIERKTSNIDFSVAGGIFITG